MAEALSGSEVTGAVDGELAAVFAALVDADQAPSLEARLSAIAGGIQRLGYSAAAIVLVSASGAPEFVIAADSTPGDVDDLVARAKPASLDEPLDDEAPALAFPLAAATGRPLARLVVGRGDDGYPAARTPLLRLLATRALRAIDDARLVEVAERRAARLQRLQEVGGMLARSLNEREIGRELARQVQRVLPCQGVILAHPDVERGVVHIALHIDGGTERLRGTETLGPGIIHDVAHSGQTVRIDRVGAAAPSVAAVADLVGGVAVSVGSVLAAPMLVGMHLVGVVAIYGSARTVFNAEDEELLGTIASQAASAIVNARLFDESQRERRQSEALSEIARAVGESLRVTEVLRLIQRHAMALLRAQGATVMIRKGEYLHVVAGMGSGDLLGGMYLPLTASLGGRAVRTGQCVISNDTASDPDTYRPTRELAVIRRTVIAPLITERGAIGAIAVMDRDGDFGPEDARVLQRLADHVAVAVVNARLYEELADATRELAVTFDAIAGGLAVVDDEGRLQRCNSRAVDLLGAPNEAAIYLRQFAEALVGDAGDAWPVTRALAERTAHVATVRNADTGRVFTLLASPHPNGGAVVFFDDVTSVRALEDRYRDLMESASDAIYTLDRQATITAANAATSALLGKPREQLIGRSMIPFIDPEELEGLRVHFHAARAGESRRYECQFVRADGTMRLLSVSNTPIREGEDVVGILGIARDVTDERMAGAALQRAESRCTRLVESASDSIFTVDEEGVFTSVNRALEDAAGRPRNALIGYHFIEIFDERDRGTAWEMFAETLGGESVRREVRLDTATGTSATVNIVTAPVVEGERVVGVLAILRDVTEERALMAQFSRRERLAALGQLVSGVANELRDPLANIEANARLVSDAVAGGAIAHEAAHAISADTLRASTIVGKLLAFVRHGDATRVTVDLNRVVRDTIELRRHGLDRQQIELVTRLDPHLAAVTGDPSQLQQVFVNLLANAEQAVLEGNQTRRVEVTTEQSAGKVRVSVRDSGVGIPPEYIDRIFNPFFTTKPRGFGTGLGLSISDGIVRDHGGRLYVQSSPGAGTTFLVELSASGGGNR